MPITLACMLCICTLVCWSDRGGIAIGRVRLIPPLYDAAVNVVYSVNGDFVLLVLGVAMAVYRIGGALVSEEDNFSLWAWAGSP